MRKHFVISVGCEYGCYGNEIGKIIEKYLLCGDTETLSKFSSTLTNCILRISSFIKNNNGELIMAGGDNVLACLPEDVFLILKEFIKRILFFLTTDYYHATMFSFITNLP